MNVRDTSYLFISSFYSMIIYKKTSTNFDGLVFSHNWYYFKVCVMSLFGYFLLRVCKDIVLFIIVFQVFLVVSYPSIFFFIFFFLIISGRSEGVGIFGLFASAFLAVIVLRVQQIVEQNVVDGALTFFICIVFQHSFHHFLVHFLLHFLHHSLVEEIFVLKVHVFIVQIVI